jgi:hypothetical protein
MGRFDEMETIVVANVMRMRRGKRQYRRGAEMGLLPVELSGDEGLQRRNEDESAW